MHDVKARTRKPVARRYIGVIGVAKCSRSVRKLAEDVGRGVAKSGAVLVCGGKGQLTAGMMIDTSPLNPT
jgi:predicted Rossmann-fold nucleotide-binding protein